MPKARGSSMVNTKLNFYFFGDVGEYDNYNPAYVCNKEYAPEILYLIAKNEPFSISKFEIAKSLDINEETIESVINNLQLIDAIEVKENTYRIKFPVFLKEDVIELERCINRLGEIIGEKIIGMKDIIYKKVLELSCSKSHSYERVLYHVICDEIFDGTAFKFFSERSLFCVSKPQPGNRDYIIVAYEDSEVVEKHSNKLLCSSNNYRCSEFTFNSFGDSNGLRKDMYRFFRLIQESVHNATPFNKVNVAYNKILDDMNKEIICECGRLISNIISNNIKFNQLSEKEKNLAKFLDELEYIDININDNTLLINIPVFYGFEISTVIKEISDTILINIYPIVKDVFDNFEANVSKVTPVRHRVNIKETANEVWHQIFGAINEYLVKEGFVTLPHDKEGEGRYLRSLIISQNQF